MIAYEKLPLDNEVKAALEGLEIEYVFQPIFYKDCVRIYAYEALMRPKKMTVGQLIDEFARDEKLHILEVATFFGATQAYIERGYQDSGKLAELIYGIDIDFSGIPIGKSFVRGKGHI